ncbi:hypothetical protein ACFSC3_09470 [Sphingomonas floccifaciens]|uniref:Uncharacterized protein n=1 Tax=Sphingomonas floccifaciens TaxID=1844115 RepID=A0ABW4NCB4_9SPHN
MIAATAAPALAQSAQTAPSTDKSVSREDAKSARSISEKGVPARKIHPKANSISEQGVDTSKKSINEKGVK